MVQRGHTLSQLLVELRRDFAKAGIIRPAGDGRALIAGLLGLSLTDLVTRPDRLLSEREVALVKEAAHRRVLGEPVHRILGWREFHGLKLYLSQDALEPRPDTEILVDAVLPFVRERAERRGTCRVLDLGTGTGAIALAILAACPGATAVGTDIAEGALAAARGNAERCDLAGRFTALCSDWFSNVEGPFDLIVSNPPYIPTGDIAGLAPEVRDFDPPAALNGGTDGLEAYRAIAGGAGAALAPDGLIAVETGHDQHAAVGTLFEAAGFKLIRALKDYGGLDRALTFRVDRL